MEAKDGTIQLAKHLDQGQDMTGFHCSVDHDPIANEFTLWFTNGDGDVIASHRASARGMSNLATGLDVQADEARTKGKGVEVVVPESQGSKTGYRLTLTARSAEILADQIRLALVQHCVDLKGMEGRSAAPVRIRR